MAIAFNKQTGVTATNGTSAAASFASLPSASDLIVLYVSFFSSVSPLISSVVDNQGNTYNLLAASSAYAPINNKTAIYYAEGIGSPSGTHTVTVNFSGSHDVVLYAASFSGVATSSSVRGTAQTAAVNSTATGANVTSDANPVSGDLIVAVASPAVAGSSNVHVVGATSGYTNLALSQNYTSFNSIAADYKLSAGGSTTANWSHDSCAASSDGWGAVIGCFKADGAVTVVSRFKTLLGVGR